MAPRRQSLIVLPLAIAMAATGSSQTPVERPPCGPTSATAGPPAMRRVNGLAVAADAAGNVFVADIGKAAVYSLSPSGALTSFAGTGAVGYGGDGGPAVAATLGIVTAIATDSAGSLYIAETVSPRVRKVTPAGILQDASGRSRLRESSRPSQALGAEPAS